MYNFDPEQLRTFEADAAEQFRTAVPFRHFVIDDFVDAETIDRINSEFAEVATRRHEWQRFSSGAEVKFALADLTRMGRARRTSSQPSIRIRSLVSSSA